MDVAARLEYIMTALMRRLLPPLLGLLAACQQTGGSERGADTSIAHAAGPTSTEMAAALKGKTPGVSSSTGSDPASSGGPSDITLTPVAIDANRKRETADVYVDMNDPSGMKGLTYYLMKSDEWFIEKVVQLTPTRKHWRFWRFVRTDGKALPEVDPLRPKR